MPFFSFLDIMDATDINWEPILEMLPTQEMKDYDERMKYKICMLGDENKWLILIQGNV